MIWIMLHPRATPEMLGFLPGFLSEDDPRPAKEQFNERYISGWHSFPGFTFDKEKLQLNYPGDPPMVAIASTMLRNEEIILFQHAWVLILQDDGTWDVSRMD